MLSSVVQAGEPGMGRPTPENIQEFACIQGTIKMPTAQYSQFRGEEIKSLKDS